MIIDHQNTFQRCPELLQSVCQARVDMANLWISHFTDKDDDSCKFYESQIRNYRHYDV